jgi:CheY-like chemotaxis protein
MGTVLAFVTLVDDLFFLAKIQETAKAVGARVVALNSRSTLAAIAEAHPQAILLDLNTPGLAALDWIRTLKAEPLTRSLRIVAFVSHLQGDLISEARAAGCDSVMSRSAFTQQLPNLLQGLARYTERPES